MKQKVSVIIPTYKSGETLIRAVDSVLNQSYQNFQVIVVDDNNPDSEYRLRTEKLMEKYSNEERVIYLKHKENKNGSAARNTAFAYSSGDYIAFLDDDDFFLPTKLAHQVNFLNQYNEFGGCYCWRLDKGENVCGTYEGDFSYELLALEFTPYTSAIMIRRECYEALHGFDESFRRHQDFEFLLRFFEKYKMGYVPFIDLVLSTNGVNNTPKGASFVKVKEHFFENFSETINRVTSGDLKKKKLIYANHFSDLFKDLIRYGYPLLALRVYFKYGRLGGFKFWELFFSKCFSGLKERFQKL